MMDDVAVRSRDTVETRPGARSINALGRRVELTGALALLLLYIAVMSGRVYSTDGALMFRQAESIVFERSLRFSVPFSERAPHLTSRYGIGQTLLYLPGVYTYSLMDPGLARTAMQPWDPYRFYNDPVYRWSGGAVNAIITAATAYLVARFVRALGFSRRAALWGLTLYGVASPAIAYVRSDWSQPLEALCWIAALYWAFQYSRSRRLGDASIAGMAVCYAVLTRPVEGILIALAAGFLAAPGAGLGRWDRSGWKGVLAVCVGLVAGVGVTLLVNWGRFGSPWVTGYEGEGWTGQITTGLAGALVSPGKGILWEFPAVILAPLGLRLLWQGPYRKAALIMAGLVVAQLINVAAWWTWWGGWNWGLRLFMPALPLLAVLAVCGVYGLAQGTRRWLPALLFVAGVIWVVPSVVTDISGGYARAYNTSEANFRLEAYPPLGAWQYFDHWIARSEVDSQAADILWLRLARSTGNASLAVPIILMIGVAVLGYRVVAEQAQSSTRKDSVVKGRGAAAG